MEIIKKHTTVNFSKGNSGRKYIVIHYTGNNTDTAAGNANYFSSVNRQASAHYFVDEKDVYEVVSPDDTAWAVGVNYGRNNLFGTCTNRNSISIEMCSTGGKIGTNTFAHTVELVKYLMGKYGIPASHVVRHYDVCTKRCPGWSGWLPPNESLWINFKAAIGVQPATSSTVTEESKPDQASGKIHVDGYWGKDTTRLAQQVFGTPVDGIVSGQYSGNKKYLSACQPNSWIFQTKATGSQLVKAIQRWAGAEADGIAGRATVVAMQKKLGATADGYLGKKTCKTFQKWLNNQ